MPASFKVDGDNIIPDFGESAIARVTPVDSCFWWLFIIWLLTAAAQKTGITELAAKALDLAKKRLPHDQWPEYYDSRCGRLVGRQARAFQTWTMAGFLSAKALLDDPTHLQLITFEEAPTALACNN